MKRHLAILVSLVIWCCALSSGYATTKYWKLNATAVGAGSATPNGVWDTSSSKWSTLSSGTSALTTFATGDDAVFSAGADATGSFGVTVASVISANSVSVEEGTIVTFGPGTIVLTGSGGTFNVNAGVVANIATGSGGYIGGTVGLTKTGTGNLDVGANSRYSGNSTINGGFCWFRSTTAANNPFGTTTTATLSLDGGGIAAAPNAGSGPRVLKDTYVISINGANDGTLAAWDTTATLSYAGAISGTKGLSINPDNTSRGTVLLTGASTGFSGPVTLKGGKLQVGNNSAIGTGTLTLSAGTLSSDGTAARSLTMPVDVSGDVALGSTAQTGALNFGTGAWRLVGGTRTLTVNSAVTVNSAIGNDGSTRALTKAGSGTLVLGNANNYGGLTTVSAGTLEGQVASSIPADVTVGSSGIIKLSSTTAMASGATLTLAAAPVSSTVNLNLSGGTLTINKLYFGTKLKAAGTWGVSGADHTDAAFSGSGLLNVTTGPAATVGAIAPVCAGSPSSLSATVTGNSPGGNVEFFDVGGVGSLGTASLSAGTATKSVTLSVGTHTIKAQYLGDSNNDPSPLSGAQTATVNPLPTASVNSPAICAGASATLTATTDASTPTYVWSPGGDTTASITVSPTSTTTYTVTVTDSVTGCANTGTGTVTVHSVPSPSTPTVNSPVCSGGAANFSVTATGGGTLSYAWRKIGAGWGSGNQWQLANGANSGFFIGSSAANGTGCSSGDINTSGKSWGLWANGGDTASAVRTWGSALSVGQTVQLDMDNGWVDGTGTVGFGLRNSSGENVWEFYFKAGDGNYTINDSVGPTATGAGWTDGGVRIAFTLTSASTYSVTVITTPLGTPTSYGPYTGSLMNPSGGQAIAQLRLFNADAGSYCNHDAFFNSIVIGGYYDDNAAAYSGWSNGDNLGNGPISGANSSTYSINPASTSDSGSYDVVVKNECGQATSSPVSLTVNPLPTANVNSPTICAGASATLTASTDTGTSYLWAPGGETTSAITVSPTATASYTVTVTDGATTCQNSGIGTVTVNPLPTAGVNSPAICAGGSATLTATTDTGTSYLWAPGGETTAAITVSPTATASYTVTVTDGATTCQNSGIGTVTVNPLPTAGVNSAAICAGGSATLTASTDTGTSYLWAPGGATTAAITVSPTATASYTVTVTDDATTCQNSGIGTVTVNPLPTAGVNSATICAGASATLTASTDTGTSYLWAPGGATTAAITVSPTATASYTVTVTDGATTCQNSAIGTVTVNPLPTASVNSETICAGGSATLTASTDTGTSYLWAPGGATTAAITVSPTATASYTVTVTDGATTCQNSGIGTVTVNPLPTAGVNSATICAGGSATLTASTDTGTSYLWAPGGATTAAITVSPTATAIYTVTVTDGVTGCQKSGSGTVTVNPLPTASVNSETICAGASATLTATSSAASPTYSWSPGGDTTASITVSPTSTESYTVTVTDGVTGCQKSGSGTVTVNALPSASVNSETICAGASATLTATTGAASPSYAWSPGAATTASITVSPTSTESYTVTVTDGVTGCQKSGSGTVTVNPLPTASVNSETICAGASATLTATSSAASPTYSWSPGGDTTASITVSPSSTASYTVTVTDGVTTCQKSGSGTVTVNVCKSPVTIDSIVDNHDGSITINYSGGAGASFTLMKSSDVTLSPLDSWTVVTNPPDQPATPGSFTITPAGNEFYAIRSN